MEEERKRVYLHIPQSINKPTNRIPKREERKSINDLPIEETEIHIQDVVVIGSHLISVMGIKVGDFVSKLEAVLCKQGIKYTYDNEGVDVPSKLIKIHPSFVFVISDKTARFHLEILCDNGSVISSFFFCSENGSMFEPQVEAFNRLTNIFSCNKYAIPKKQKKDGDLCVRQDYFTIQNAAKIERSDDFVSLEIMSKKRFEETVLKWYEKEVFKNKIATILYVTGLFGLPVYKLFIEQSVHIGGLNDILAVFGAFVPYLICWWFIFTPACWIVASFFFLKGEDAKGMRFGCGYPALFVIMLVASGTIYEKCINNSKPKSQPHGIYAPTKTTTGNNHSIDNGVYICTGPQSRRYHRSRYCRGLNSCSDDIEEVDVSTAEDYGRTPCGICY